MGNLTGYVDQFGYIVLFAALLLEMLAVPLPGEFLMSYSGFLVYQGHLGLTLSILAAGLGSSIGMTAAYWIGYKLGTPFFEKYGHRFHMGPERIEKTSRWFGKHGNKLLIIAYFIPGVRHITGYFSGITRLSFRTYILFAYSGAFLWVSVFIFLGKILGPQWEQFHTSVKKYLIIGSMIIIGILTVLYVYKKYKLALKDFVMKLLELTLSLLHTTKRVGLFITATAMGTLGLIILMMGMIQDFFGNEFQDFNELAELLISSAFGDKWIDLMLFFNSFVSRKVLTTLLLLIIIWILFKGRNKVLELSSLVFTVCGGELYEESLRKIFHDFSPVKSSSDQAFYSFPSEQSLMTIVIYGFVVFIFVRTVRRIWIHSFVLIMTLFLLFFIAIARLSLAIELPSDAAAGYVFGGGWLGLNMLLLESLRLLMKMDSRPLGKE
ncbi:alkaline phosphatase [Bacillus sp. FJAT-27231]|uniref:VTT domain-containing protein n=1 Tax=Bacillus sp. FJAT-27231 TaxID=1679168 RepID=UPI00067160DB|nr:VTT domain-containing protein [Bacillus sp. FJAT-27231]KMY54124.1 alkaline phosphatase [Bacillus sp. FJAT-27231]